jgi:DNA-binding GntR family transcriptional regulator
MSGEFAPGDRLTVRGIAERMGTSVMPVREALRRLTAAGALEPLSTGATRVPVLDFGRLQDIMEIRATMEGLAARRAAERITENEFRRLIEVNNEVMEAARSGDVAVEVRANERFHFIIYRAAGSEELLRIIQLLWVQIGPYLLWLLRRGVPEKPRSVRVAFRYHKEIIEALRLRDGPAAEAALKSDLSVAARRFTMLARRLPGA